MVQPVSTDEVLFIVHFAAEKNIPLTPRGGATSGWGGAIPARGGIVVDFSKMRKILEIDAEKNTAKVEAGVIWNNLENELNKRGLSLRIYPSSSPSATVAGWVAEGGGGIGSYEYGRINNNIESVKMVTADGKVRTIEGEELEMVADAEGITGLITEVVVKTRPKDGDIPTVASFPDMKRLFKALHEVEQNSLKVWHISVSNATSLEKREEAKRDAQKVKEKWECCVEKTVIAKREDKKSKLLLV